MPKLLWVFLIIIIVEYAPKPFSNYQGPSIMVAITVAIAITLMVINHSIAGVVVIVFIMRTIVYRETKP